MAEEQSDVGGALLVEMREAFDRREWDRTLEIYGRLREVFVGQRNLRVEGTCLAARALVARNDRAAARSLLKPIGTSEYTKAIHYHFLAHAFLDLRSYREVARVCERAAALLEIEKPPG